MLRVLIGDSDTLQLTRFSHENPGSGQIWIWRGSIQDVVTHDVNLLIVLGIDQRSFALR
jgi:hypothetical protein